jgi:hypothetical protein
MMRLYRYLTARRDAKGNAVFCSNSKLMRDIFWNESKLRGLRQIKNTGGWLAEFSALIAPPPPSPSRYHRSSPIEVRPFIEHSSEMWNFCRDRLRRCGPFLFAREVRP